MFPPQNMSARNSSSYHLPTMKREHVTEECAVQVPMGSTSGTLDASAFHLANNADLVAVLKALQVILKKYSTTTNNYAICLVQFYKRNLVKCK